MYSRNFQKTARHDRGMQNCYLEHATLVEGRPIACSYTTRPARSLGFVLRRLNRVQVHGVLGDVGGRRRALACRLPSAHCGDELTKRPRSEAVWSTRAPRVHS